MFLHSLHLYNFKNHSETLFRFHKNIVCFTGFNGAGKTNLLDAIYYLCITKSYFNATDQQLIRHEQVSFRLDGIFSASEENIQVKCLLPRERKKEIWANEVKYEKLSHHLGLLPVVMVSPDDHVLIYGGSEERRRFLDSTLSQMDRSYLEALQEYNRYLLQRNALLKQFAEQQKFDANLLLAYDVKMAPTGDFIFEKRKTFAEVFVPYFNTIYKEISGDSEQVAFNYRSDVSEKKMAEVLQENIDKDRLMKRTTGGIHRDDIEFMMDGEAIKKFGSQGQQKTFLLSLKLAQAHLLQTHLQKTPLLLLDDIFDKLDTHRSFQLLHYIRENYQGQIFITDTQRARIEQNFADAMNGVEVFEIG